MPIGIDNMRRRKYDDRKRSLEKLEKYKTHYEIFATSKCYFTNRQIGCGRRRIKLDLQMYWYGLRCRNRVLVAHARHHFVQHAHKDWPRVASLVIEMLFRDRQFRFLGELKELAVRVARDHACLDKYLPQASKATLISKKIRRRKQREFQFMLEEELGHAWVRGRMWACPPPNTWIHYEELYRAELARIHKCDHH